MGELLPSGLEVSAPRMSEERRSHQRFDLELPLRYKILGDGSDSTREGGKTINISSSGVLFEANEKVDVQSRLELLIQWPAQRAVKTRTKLYAEGYVVRCYGDRIAVAFTHRAFRRA